MTPATNRAASSPDRVPPELRSTIDTTTLLRPAPSRSASCQICETVQASSIAPAEEAVYRIRVRGRRAGDQRVQVQLVSEDHPTPITKEEITRVYLDR